MTENHPMIFTQLELGLKKLDTLWPSNNRDKVDLTSSVGFFFEHFRQSPVIDLGSRVLSSLTIWDPSWEWFIASWELLEGFCWIEHRNVVG